MRQKSINTRSFNWNVFNVLVAIIGLILVFKTTDNQKEISLLKTELEKSQKENNDKKDTVNNNLYGRINDLRTYYETELTTLRDTLTEVRAQYLNKASNSGSTKKGNITLPLSLFDSVLHTLVDAILVKKNLISAQNSVKLYNKELESKNNLIKLLGRAKSSDSNIIVFLKAEIEKRDNIISEYKKNGDSSNIPNLIVLVSLMILFFACLFLFLRNRRLRREYSQKV